MNGQAQYFLNDHLGSTNALTDATGNVIASTNYDSFGNASNASFPTRYQFTGREFDSLTGLQYSRARFYSPEIGRFISEDPIGLTGGINQFGYVGGNPANFSDPFGQDEYSMMERFGNQRPSNRGIEEILDDLQLQLGSLGLAPGIGEPFDAIDGVICFLRGDYSGAALSGTSMFPFAGVGAGITKIGKRSGKMGTQFQLPFENRTIHPKVPDYTGGKTSGILDVGGNETPIISGYDGPSKMMPKGTPGMNGNIKSHVEAHASSLMRSNGYQNATLYINREPCSGSRGCGAMLPNMLPPGANLRVIGPNGFDKNYFGLPDR